MHVHFLSFYKYWPDDGLIRPKLIKKPTSETIKQKDSLPDGVHVLFHFNYESWFYQCLHLRSELKIITAIMNVTVFRPLHCLRHVPSSSIFFQSLFFFLFSINSLKCASYCAYFMNGWI